jgi:hypothetical protein
MVHYDLLLGNPTKDKLAPFVAVLREHTTRARRRRSCAAASAASATVLCK